VLIQKKPLPLTIVKKTKICFLDFLSACYSGATSKEASIGLSVLKEMGGGRSTLIGCKEKRKEYSCPKF